MAWLAVCAGDNPSVPFVWPVPSLLMMLPSTVERCVMLKVSASCPSDGSVTVKSSVFETSSIIGCRSSPSISIRSWTPTIGSDASPELLSSIVESSPFPSSDSPEADSCCLRAGRCLVAAACGWLRGCTGPLGVVGESGWDATPTGRLGSMLGSRSVSRTGRNPNPSAVSMGGTAVASGCIARWR